MLRILGFVFVVVICVETVPWSVLVGVILFVGWLLVKPAPLPGTDGVRSRDEDLRVVNPGSRSLNAIPLLNAVYCVNCDLITNSSHDDCRVCGSHALVVVSRMWQIASAQAPTIAAKYKVSFTVDVCEIPADGLNESTKLICRLAELGGNVKTFHITVDPVFAGDAILNDAKLDMRKPVGRIATQHVATSSLSNIEYPTITSIAG